MKNDTSYIMTDHASCYQKLGLSDDDIANYQKRGKYFNHLTQTDVERHGFYGRLKLDSTNFLKDEL